MLTGIYVFVCNIFVYMFTAIVYIQRLVYTLFHLHRGTVNPGYTCTSICNYGTIITIAVYLKSNYVCIAKSSK